MLCIQGKVQQELGSHEPSCLSKESLIYQEWVSLGIPAASSVWLGAAHGSVPWAHTYPETDCRHWAHGQLCSPSWRSGSPILFIAMKEALFERLK